MRPTIPTSRLYAILDAESCVRRGFALLAVAEAWLAAGISLLQYRDKQATDAEVLRNALDIRQTFAGTGATLILNDRTHLFTASGFHGLHIGQADGDVQKVRQVIGTDAILGLSTHTAPEVKAADRQSCDYIAVGPVFPTATKLDAEPSVGLEGVRAARALTGKPLVAIGGIGLQNAGDVRASGADAVALISALLPVDGDGADGLQQTAQDFLRALQ